MTPMGSPDDWENRAKMLDLLAHRLVKQRIAIFLGAGASQAFGLPKWTELIDKMFSNAGESRPALKSDTVDAENLFVNKYKSNRATFAGAVREALYLNYTSTPKDLENSRLLSALGALVMSSTRGRASNVVTFNYDDILEEYLRWRGYVVESIDSLPTWAASSDVRVLHPHGLLRLDAKVTVQQGVVLTQMDYDAIVGDAKDLWRQKITDVMRSATCIFIGLSGVDNNLTSMLNEVKDSHSIAGSEPYWGVRFGLTGDAAASTWKNRGVYPLELASHDDAPDVLLGICQRAAAIRMVE